MIKVRFSRKSLIEKLSRDLCRTHRVRAKKKKKPIKLITNAERIFWNSL